VEPGTPAVLVTVTGGRDSDQGILAAWADGVIVWSDNLVRGGAPYHVARIEPRAVAHVIDELARQGRWVGERRFGPDSRWTHIVVAAGSNVVIDVGSWHELYESNPALVATSTGIEPLAGRAHAEVLARQPADYRAFRHRWEQVRARLLALIPASGEPASPGDTERIPW
jgi:hypothetical protein